MSNLLIGNIISFISAIFLGISCYAKNRKQIFAYQLINCATYIIASYFFGAYATMTTLMCCCLRNIFILNNKFNKTAAYTLSIAVVVFGVLANNRGLVGMLPVIATVEYTLCCYYITDPHATRYSIIFNEFIWVVYAFIIKDFSTCISDSIVILADICAIVHYHNKSNMTEMEQAALK